VIKIENIVITNLSEFCNYCEGDWSYYGECDKNNVPWGIGRLISKYESMFIDCYFKKG